MSEHAQPTIYNGIMYVVNGHWTFAIDVATGEQIGALRLSISVRRRGSGSRAIIRGGATIYEGKLFRQQIDAHVVALDMKTGKEVWKQKFADYKEGYTGRPLRVIRTPFAMSGAMIPCSRPERAADIRPVDLAKLTILVEIVAPSRTL